jgi:hypothetical protein
MENLKMVVGLLIIAAVVLLLRIVGMPRKGGK